MGRFNTACEKAPAGAAPRIMLLQHTYVASDAADVEEAAKEISVYYNYFLLGSRMSAPSAKG